MRRLTLLLVCFLFVLPLAFAAPSVTTNKVSYLANEQVDIIVAGCTTRAFVDVINSQGAEVFSDLNSGDPWTSRYHTSSSTATGEYIARVTCGSTIAEKKFTVGTTTTQQTTCQDGDNIKANNCQCKAPLQNVNGVCTTPPNPGGNRGGSSGGGGGGGGNCPGTWECGAWSYCTADLNQTRTCRDVSTCRRPDRVEVQTCQPCQEQWICSEWSACINGVEKRTCYDERSCSTAQRKPALERSCGAAGTDNFNPPLRIDPELQPPQEQQPSAGLWERYSLYFIFVPLAIILIVLIILLILHYRNHHKVMYNYDELLEWIQKERAMGTSDQDVREIIKDHTNWSDEEITQAFDHLH